MQEFIDILSQHYFISNYYPTSFWGAINFISVLGVILGVISVFMEWLFPSKYDAVMSRKNEINIKKALKNKNRKNKNRKNKNRKNKNSIYIMTNIFFGICFIFLSYSIAFNISDNVREVKINEYIINNGEKEIIPIDYLKVSNIDTVTVKYIKDAYFFEGTYNKDEIIIDANVEKTYIERYFIELSEKEVDTIKSESLKFKNFLQYSNVDLLELIDGKDLVAHNKLVIGLDYIQQLKD